MFLIMFAAATAGLLTMWFTASTCLLWALLAGPIVGSVSGFCAALYLAWHRGFERMIDYDLDRQSNAMVGALGSLAEQGRAVDAAPISRAPKPSQAA